MSLGRGGNYGVHKSGGGASGWKVMPLDEDDGEDMISSSRRLRSHTS